MSRCRRVGRHHRLRRLGSHAPYLGAADPVLSCATRGRPAEVSGGISPDGRTIAFDGVRAGQRQVYLRRLDQLEAVPVQGTEGTVFTGFSSDGAWLLVTDLRAGDGDGRHE